MPSGVKDIQLLELKDTISQLNKTISTQNELISSLQKMLEERNAKDSEKDLLIANLQSQLAYLKNKVFGSTSEIRHDQLDGQLNLFGTPVGDEKPAEVIEPEVISVKGYTKERKPKATYDDKYNSVRSICKHFFTDIVGLSIKFFCVSLRHMSIIGWSITEEEIEEYPHLRFASGESDTGVIVSFNSEAESITDSLIIPAGTKTMAINPLNWKTDSTPAGKEKNLGSCFTNYDGEIEKEIEHLTGAYIDPKRGALKVTDVSPKDYPAGLYIFRDGIYHLYDYQFFYRNLQENVSVRTDAYLSQF